MFEHPLPFAESGLAWGEWLADQLRHDTNGLILQLKLLQKIQSGTLSTEEKIKAEAELKSGLNEPKFYPEVPNFLGAERVLTQVMCKELSGDWYHGTFNLTGSSLSNQIAAGWPTENLCNHVHLQTAYDSADYQIRVPIYYLQGTADPQTPLESALYHFDHQRLASTKVFAKVRNGGHHLTEARLATCMSTIWTRIFKGEVFSGVLDGDGGCI